MLLELVLPPIVGETEKVRLDAIHFAAGDALVRNARLIDFTTGLFDAAMHDCPSVTTHRVMLSEAVWVREIRVETGRIVGRGDVLALLSTTPDEAVTGRPERRCRTTSAAILKRLAW